jgi:hypothetical protein
MPVIRFFYGFIAAILPNLRKILMAFREKGSKIPFWTAITDSLFVLRGMWLFLFLNLAGLVFFIFLTQGTDILTAIMEDTRQSYAGTILWLVLGAFFWSIVAEFGARYTMNVTDNSGKTLTDERVEWRKLLQSFYSKFFLFLPSTILILGFIKAASLNYSFTLSGVIKSWRDVGMTLLIFVVLFITIYHMYINPDWKRGIKNLFRFLRFSPPDVPQDDEHKWQDKLYGIYRDYIFMYPEASIPKDILTPKKQLKTEEKESQQDDALLNYPQSELFPPRIKVPAKFKVIRFERPKDGDIWCRWIYKVPLSFFPRLHRQVAIISLTGIAIILLVSVLPVDTYKNIGSPGLIAFAFAAWLGVYIGLVYLEYANPFKWNPPWRLLLFLWMLYCSSINHDHPIRKKSDDINAADSRPLLKNHFDRWASMHPNDSIVVFVCAEGGALRTGAFSSMILSKLQDRDTSFKDRIFAFSSVSGGSLGIGYFNALAYFNNHRDLMNDPSFYSNKTKDFFTRDHLAPLIGKLFYGDIINLFSPRMIPVFDRAGALEKSWELGYEQNATFNDNTNVFASDYYSVYNPKDSGWYPAWFINTEEVETGLQGWITNVDARALPLSRNRDILRKVEGTIRYSTAVNFSTRFPLFSPGGALDYQLHRYHYVDGGYIENYGAQTMLEVLQELRNDTLFRNYKPYVMVIQFGNDSRAVPGTVTFANELTEIVNGIYNTRNGRGVKAKLDLKNFVTDSLKGKLVDIPLDMSNAKVPMNWILSDTSLRRLDQYCDKLINRNASIKDILQVMKYKRIPPPPPSPMMPPDSTK